MNGKIYGLSSSENPEDIKYIGYTKLSLKERLRGHRDDAIRKKYKKATWIKSLQNKGFNVIISLIEDNIPTLEEMQEKEIQYIKIFKSLGAKLKNTTDGGAKVCSFENSVRSGKLNTKAVIQYDLFGNKIKEYNSVGEAAKDNNIVDTAITKSVKRGQVVLKKYLFRYKDEIFKDIKNFRTKTRKVLPVKLINIETREVKNYENTKFLVKGLFGETWNMNDYNSALICLKNNKIYKGKFKIEYYA